jgi:hypothetical protein
MRSRSAALRRICWQAARAVALYTVDGMTGYGLAMYAVPRSAVTDGQPSQAELALAGLTYPAELAGLADQVAAAGPQGQARQAAPDGLSGPALTRRERRQWARLARQLQ